MSKNYQESSGLESKYHWAALCDALNNSTSCVKMYEKEKHGTEADYDWLADGRPILYNELIRVGRLIGAVDMGKGLDLFWDGKQWHVAKYGVFTEKYVFVTDYYGFPQGALFERRLTPTVPLAEQLKNSPIAEANKKSWDRVSKPRKRSYGPPSNDPGFDRQ